MFRSLLGLVSDVVDVADAVVSVPVAVVRGVTKPVAEAACCIKEEIEDLLED